MTPDLCIVGGAGHVGLPLGIVLAHHGLRVRLCDRNEQALRSIQQGQMPFQDEGAPELLKKALTDGLLSFTSETRGIAGVPVVVVTVGTPVDEFLKPDPQVIKSWAEEALPFLSSDQLVVLRSTVYPGTTNWLDQYFRSKGLPVQLAFCPERIAQGQAIRELQQLPQLVSGTTSEAEDQAAQLFQRIAPEVIRLPPLEAEFAKLFTNSYRYIQFAIVNQFYMLATQHGADFQRILHACRHRYPRTAGMPSAGLTAGPCLLKDAMQLVAFSDNHFSLGHQAMLVNEGLPAFLVNMVKREVDLSGVTVGILGMAFKAESDDVRDSLSYRLRKLLMMEARNVLCSDPYADDPRLVSEQQLLEQASVIFIGTPHRRYQSLCLRDDQRLIDIWGCVSGRENPGTTGGAW